MTVDCLSAERVYEYLEGGLSPVERASFEAHLAACPACRAAVETRRRIAEAAAALPPFEVPADFAASVMSRLDAAPRQAPAKARAGLLAWLAAAAGGLFVLGGTYVLAAVFAGQSLAQALGRLNGLAWSVVRGAAYYSIKGLTILVLAVEIFARLVGYALETLRTVLAAASPVLPAVALVLTIALLVAAGLWVDQRRRHSREERIHEN